MNRIDSDLDRPDGRDDLRARMNAAVSGVRMTPSLLDSAVRANRHRTARYWLTGAGSLAIVAAAAVAVAVILPVPANGHPAPARSATPSVTPKAETAVYILNRAAAALVNSYRLISVDRAGGESGTNYTDVSLQRQRIVSGLLDSAGKPYFQSLTTVRHGLFTELDVEYQHHVWSTFSASDIDDGSKVILSSFLPLQGDPHPAVAFRRALAAGVVSVVGPRRLHGQNTILIYVKDLGRLKAGSAAGLRRSGDPRQAEEWIWLNASTYQVVQTKHYIRDPDSNGWKPDFDHITWLPATHRNLMLLKLKPPAGFTQVTYHEMAQKYLGPIS